MFESYYGSVERGHSDQLHSGNGEFESVLW